MKLTELFRQAERETIEAWCRGKTQTAYLGKHNALCRVLGTFLMYVDTQDRSLAPHLMLDGYWEMWVTQAIASFVKPGMICIDVGANYGYFSLFLAELVGEKGHVFAYEPQAEVHRKLAASVELNGFAGRVSASACAISDTLTTANLWIDPERLGAASLTQFGPNATLQSGAVVGPLDALFGEQDIKPVDFVKIDVQGEEMRVLRGMQNMIQASPHIAIAMEFTPGQSRTPKEDLETIVGYGLKIQTIGHDGIVRPIDLDQAAKADTGDHRMLWLTRSS